MKKTKLIKQPPQQELQFLHQQFQAGRFEQVERHVKNLLKQYKNSPVLFNILGLSQQQQQKYPQALNSYRKLLSLDPKIPEVHFNLGLLFAQSNKLTEAETCYRKAIKLNPQMAPAFFNLGVLYQQQDRLDKAAEMYQKALSIDPNHHEALTNLGTVLQRQGKLKEAEQRYRQALAIQTDAQSWLNLGTALYALGQHQQAIDAFRQALSLNPELADGWNDLGETWRDQGDMNEAIQCYQKALNIQPDHDRALYNMGEYLALANKLEQAFEYFQASNFADSQDRALQCLYKTQRFNEFSQKLAERCQQPKHTSILVGALASHYAANFQQENHYQFCRNPMAFVQHTHINELSAENSPLLQSLLHDITHLSIAERKQGRLYYGMQSAGNLLLRSENSFQQLAALIREKVQQYRQTFSHHQDHIIQYFPEQIEFSSSWYLRMKQGGYLSSHIHEEGWISGCVYLQLPERADSQEGCFSYSIDGDDYPRQHHDFPEKIADIKVGDLVLFPSSLFHRTIPFQADQERVCIAFDISPARLT
jgi:uncharacterized protein (TIGR02466 family)